MDFISTTGLKFYRFVVDNYLIKYLYRIAYDAEWLSVFSTLICQFHENTTKNHLSTEFIFANEKDAIDYSMRVIDTLLHYHLKLKINHDLVYDLKLINTIIKAICVVWQQDPSTKNSVHEK